MNRKLFKDIAISTGLAGAGLGAGIGAGIGAGTNLAYAAQQHKRKLKRKKEVIADNSYLNYNAINKINSL